jgi:hypothetical protein
MKTKKALKLFINSFIVTGCFTMAQQVHAQKFPEKAGTDYEIYVVNDNDSNSQWTSLRLQTNATLAWNMVSEGSGSTTGPGSLWWGYDASNVEEDPGTEKMRLYNNGDLSIEGKLHIKSGEDVTLLSKGYLMIGSATGLNLAIDNNEIEARYNEANSPLYLQSDGGDMVIHHGKNSSERFIVKEGGNVGIGTTTPTAKLDVAGDMQLTGENRVFKGAAWVSNAVGDLDDFSSISDVGFYAVSGNHLQFVTGQQDMMRITGSGNVGIGTTSPTQKLDVAGNIKANGVEAVGNITANGADVTGNITAGSADVAGNITANAVILNIGTFPDYVFENDYRLMPLNEVERYIKTHKHLPGFPSEAEVVQTGANLGQLNTLLIEKVEELTLHTIAQEKQIETLTGELVLLKEQLHQLLEKQ